MNKIFALLLLILLFSCTDNAVMERYDQVQKPGEVIIKGYSKPDVLQLRFNGEPVSIDGKTSYTNKIETTLQFVLDQGETNKLAIYNHETGKEVIQYNITYDNIEEYQKLYFFHLPGIFLQAEVVKPQVNLGKIGFEFIFPNLGEFSGSSLKNVKGVLKRENGVVLAEFDNIGKNSFTPVKIYNSFGTTAPVYLELYKPGTTEPYAGSAMIKVKIKQDMGANMIILQEKSENGVWAVKGDIDVAEYL
ncbi:hypothetical protein PYS58_01015 [Chryseobacterium indologenes]|uniref:hypothetical protein n=1 Tax=Chryseobacterium TaxID=59732 RepID=UPI001E653159|nr:MULTISPECIES: hypothetical protein [Chryseobacterium]WET49717.1 hypothetical protein PYS58_01015 [Chryseobacterium indologenes]